jgi:hypothetical protein
MKKWTWVVGGVEVCNVDKVGDMAGNKHTSRVCIISLAQM